MYVPAYYAVEILFLFMRENNLFICTDTILRYTCIVSSVVPGCPPDSSEMINNWALD